MNIFFSIHYLKNGGGHITTAIKCNAFCE